ncbi:siroheme biosynthesis protein Met8p [Monosporozyma unispora]|nr:Bifunctional dehydrogenase and ferrochelatase [Kazachstania unispora]
MKSLQVAHQLVGKDVLLIGGGDVAMTRIPKLLPTGCKLTLISTNLHPNLKQKYYKDLSDKWTPQSESIYKIIESPFQDSYLDQAISWSLILTCIPDKVESKRIFHFCKGKYGPQQMINVADIPELCDFYFGANVALTKDGNLQILISSNGLSPRFTALVKDEIGNMFQDWELDGALEKLGQLRARIRGLTELDVDIKYRMSWIKSCTDTFGLKYCHSIDVDKLVGLFQSMASQEPRSLEFPSKTVMLTEYSTKN